MALSGAQPAGELVLYSESQPAPTPSPTGTDTDTPAIRALRSHLSRLARVAIQDRRVFLGVFACIDKARNVVLLNTDEMRIGAPPGTVGATGRFIGMVMIPWRHIVSFEIESVDDASMYT